MLINSINKRRVNQWIYYKFYYPEVWVLRRKRAEISFFYLFSTPTASYLVAA
jgi:hypothetical protein